MSVRHPTYHVYAADRDLGYKSAIYRIPDLQKSNTQRAEDKEAQNSELIIYREEDPNEVSSKNDCPWFVSKDGAVPEAACDWLQLLHDTRKTNLWYEIEPKRLSFDYLPRDVLRPLASADLSDFLRIMTVLGVGWEGRGANGRFIGRGALNDITVTSTEVQSVGTVYTYTRRFIRQNVNAYSVYSFFTLRSMFNCFVLNFGANYGELLTWSSDEVKDSLLDIFGDENLADHFKKTFRTDGFNIGVGELVAAWCYERSMPRREVEGRGGTKQFTTSFSATSLGCTLGIPLLASILHGNEEEMRKYNLLEETNCQKLSEWAKTYYLKSDTFDGLAECLDWVSSVSMDRNILFSSSINVKKDQKCLALLEELDEQFYDISEFIQNLDLVGRITDISS